MSKSSKLPSASRAGTWGVTLLAGLFILALAALAADNGLPVPNESPLPPLQVVPSAPERPDFDPLYRRYGVPHGACNRSAIGAVAGGLLGGVIGDRISDGKEGGVIAGSLVGAFLGNLIGRGLDEASAACGAQPGQPAPSLPAPGRGGPTLRV